MADLQQLMALDGAHAAFLMNDRGELLEHILARGTPLNETALDLLAHMCHANSAIATMQARGWSASFRPRASIPSAASQ